VLLEERRWNYNADVTIEPDLKISPEDHLHSSLSVCEMVVANFEVHNLIQLDNCISLVSFKPMLLKCSLVCLF